jgi:hypothetical protein
VIRVHLPAYLRTLARAEGEVLLDIPGPVTQRSILDALEARHPTLAGTLRDHVTGQRRAFVRFFACETDFSHESPDAPLPEAVASGAEPFLIVGAIAGGAIPDNVEMAAQSYDLHGIRLFELEADGPPLRSDRDAVDVIAEAVSHQAGLIVIPTGRLDDDFFRLRTGVAGQVVQKFVTYGRRLAIVGDISKRVEESSSLRDFVYECNSGSNIWFVASLDALGQRLQPARQ